MTTNIQQYCNLLVASRRRTYALAILMATVLVGCSQEAEEVIIEPSLLDKCVATNITALQNLSIENEAIDSLKPYVPEGAYQVYNSVFTKAEFTEYVKKFLDYKNLSSRSERMCKEINPEIKLNDKEECLDLARLSVELAPDGRSIEDTEKMFGCDLDDDSPVEQEPLVVENCLAQPEDDLLNIFLPIYKKKMDELTKEANITLKGYRLSLIENSRVISSTVKENLQPTYEHYAEVFNREAKLICNAQGIY